MPKPTTTPAPDPGDDRVILTKALLDEANARRKGAQARGRRAIAASGLIAQATDAIPWDVIADRDAAMMAQVSYTTIRAASQAADTLRRAGLPVNDAKDFTTPEAQAILEQAYDPIAPADPAILASITETIAKTITDAIASDAELRTKAATALLVDAWAGIESDPTTDGDPTDTLIDRLYTAGGWQWLVKEYHLNWSEVMGDAETLALAPMAALPAFMDGYGRTDNSPFAIGGRRAVTPGAVWELDNEWPAYHFRNHGGEALYQPSRDHFPTAQDAIREVMRYGAQHTGALLVIMAKHFRNHEAGNTGPYGGFYLGVDELLRDFGTPKHKHGGYAKEDRNRIIEAVRSLERLDVAGSITSWRGKRRETFTVKAKLVVISHTVTQKGLTGDGERVTGWYLRAGDWAAHDAMPYALRTEALLKLHGHDDLNALRLGWALEEDFRMRASERNWHQPYRMRTLLDMAGIALDRKNPRRFRGRIEAALHTLANRIDMNGTPLIAGYSYPDPIAAAGRGWFDRWLDGPVVITPDPAFLAQYEPVAKPKPAPRRRRSKAAIPAQV